MADDTRDTDTGDEGILAELRKRYDYGVEEWADIRKHGQRCMRAVAGDVWNPEERRQRELAKRPCLSPDELSQYVNQLINEIRQNKRAIQVTATGSGANDDSAELHASLIRQIEYRSNAQQAYTSMFEDTVQRNIGFLRIVPRYVRDDSDDQELIIEPIPNPDLVTMDPDALKTDGSDMRWAFIRESRSRAEFKRDFQNATIRDFDNDNIKDAPAWITEDRVWLAEYWTLETTKRTLLTLQTVEGPTQIFEDELQAKPSKASILSSRPVDVSKVMKYVTNGIEILERTAWPGKWIPIVACPGKVLWIDEGSGAKKRILSMVSLALDPAMMYAYYRTAEAEQVGMSTKFPYFIRRGSLSADEAVKLQQSLHEPVAFIQVEAVSDRLPPGMVPEMPVRNPFEPAIQALEVGAEGMRRAIQAAIGQSPLPTSAQRRNEKSGVALKQIEDAAQQGSYHFIDHYDDAITRTGDLLEDLLPYYFDTVRDVALRNPDDTTELVRINDPNPKDEKGQPVKPRMVTDGPHDITLSVGPKYDSERERASDFADTMVQSELIAKVAGPAVAAKVLAQVIRLKNLGPIGDEMADAISPPEDEQPQIPPEVLAKLQEQEQMLAQAKQMIETDQAKQQATIQKAQIDAQADQQKAAIDAEVRVKIATIQAETQIAVAQIKAAEDGVEARLKHLEEIMGHKADFLMQEREQDHQQRMGQQQHAMAVDEGERGHMQDMESGEQSG